MSTSAEMLQPLPGVIEPRWWTGSPALPPESFTIDCSAYAMDAGDLDKDSALAQRMNRMFDEVGEPNKYYTLPIGVNEDEIADKSHGTVGAVALDGNGELAAATSTGGTFGKLEGRVGDSPIIGAGTWADSDVAVACTSTGE